MKAQFVPPVALHSQPWAPLHSAISGWRNRCEQRQKREENQFPSPPHVPSQNHILLLTEYPLPPAQGFPFAESLNDLSWGQLELELWEVRG